MDLSTLQSCLIPPEKPDSERARVTVDLGQPETKAKLQLICDRHGITVSQFFRNCAETVCRELGA